MIGWMRGEGKNFKFQGQGRGSSLNLILGEMGGL